MSIKSKLAQQLQANQKAHAKAEVPLEREETLTAVLIEVDRVQANPFQPRSVFDDAAIEELAESLKNEGLLQPIVVRPNGTQGYQLISGERRLRAFKSMGRQEIPAIIKSMSDQESAVSALQENIKRENLTDFEVSEGLRKLIEIKESVGERPSPTELQRLLSVSRPAIYRYLAFHTLPDQVQSRLRAAPGLISGTTARTLEQWYHEAESRGVKLEGYPRILTDLLDEVEAGHLKQNKIRSRVESALLTSKSKPKPLTDVSELFNGDDTVGKWTTKEREVQINLPRDRFSDEQLRVIRHFITELLSSQA